MSVYIAKIKNSEHFLCFTEDCLSYIMNNQKSPYSQDIEVDRFTIEHFTGSNEHCYGEETITCPDADEDENIVVIELNIVDIDTIKIPLFKTASFNVIRKFMSNKYNVKQFSIIVNFGDDIISDYTELLEDYGLEDNARLVIHFYKHTVREVIESLEQVNDDVNFEFNFRNIHIDEEHDPHTIIGSLDLSARGIIQLPDNWGDLNITGDLYLEDNDLETLPDSFCDLNIGGDVMLAHNHLKTLPDNFGELSIGVSCI